MYNSLSIWTSEKRVYAISSHNRNCFFFVLFLSSYNTWTCGNAMRRLLSSCVFFKLLFPWMCVCVCAFFNSLLSYSSFEWFCQKKKETHTHTQYVNRLTDHYRWSVSIHYYELDIYFVLHILCFGYISEILHLRS